MSYISLPAAIYITKYNRCEISCVLFRTNYISNSVTALHLRMNRTTAHQNSNDAVPARHILLVTWLCLCVPNPLALGADSLSSHCDVSCSKKHKLGLVFWVGTAGQCRQEYNEVCSPQNLLVGTEPSNGQALFVRFVIYGDRY